jgi:hypothetical protein
MPGPSMMRIAARRQEVDRDDQTYAPVLQLPGDAHAEDVRLHRQAVANIGRSAYYYCPASSPALHCPHRTIRQP